MGWTYVAEHLGGNEFRVVATKKPWFKEPISFETTVIRRGARGSEYLTDSAGELLIRVVGYSEFKCIEAAINKVAKPSSIWKRVEPLPKAKVIK